MRRILLQILILSLFCVESQAQTRLLTGKVTEAGGEPVIGATVTIKGTKTATSTDVSGTFRINVPQAGTVILVVRYIGFRPKEVTVTDQKELSVTLIESDATLLEEVPVNIGYAVVSKDAVVGSVSSVGAKDIKDFPVATAAEALAGKLAGVSVTTSEGRPGAEIDIRVRGGGSITQDNSPLYIVDGIQVENALSVISPQEIESIDVLKDVASTAIYGARGANGVVLITTKSGGKDGTTIVSFNAFAGARQITNHLDVMKPYDFVMYQYQLYFNGTDEQTQRSFLNRYGTFDDLDIYENIPFNDWQDLVFGRNAFGHTEILNISGGNKASSFNFTVNNYKEDGIMLNSGAKRTFAAFRYDNRATEKFRFGFNARYSRQNVLGVGTSNTGSQSNNRLRNAVRYRPYMDFGMDPGVDEFDPDYANQTNLISPVLGAYAEVRNDYNNQIITGANAQYTLAKGLNIRSVFGITNTERRTDQYSSAITGVARQNANMPVVGIGTISTLTLTNSNTLSYDFTVGKEHKFTVLAGQEINQSRALNYANTVKWLPVDLTPEQAIAGIQKATPPNGAVQDPATTSESKTTLFSLFGRASYSFKDRYLASVIVRRDASSLFAPKNRNATFPSGQVAWRVSQEDFFKELQLDWFDNLKLRASYGAGGNNRIGVDLWKTLYVANNNNGYAIGEAVTPGFAPNALANPDIRWETTISRNLGLDMDFLRGRLSATIDVYSNHTKDLLLMAEIPPTSGYPQQQQNIGKTSNKGIELQLSAGLVNSKNFSYSVNFNISHNKNKIVSLGLDPFGAPKTDYLTASGGINGDDFIVQVGGPVGQFYGYVSDGRYEIDDFDITYNSSSGTYSYTLKPGIPNAKEVALGGKNPQPGDMKLKKLTDSDDDLLTVDDRKILGTAIPKFAGGFNQQFRYRNFDASLFMNFALGKKTYNANKTEFTGQYLYKDNNMLEVVKDRWKWYDENGVKVTDPDQLREMNANTTFWTPPTGQYVLTSYAIEDGSFLRISNLTIGYSLPESFLRRTRVFSRFRIYGTVNNLYTFTRYTGYDPEANTRRSPLTPGVDYSAYPRSRYILAGLDVSF